MKDTNRPPRKGQQMSKRLLALVKPAKPISQMTASERKALVDEIFRVAQR